MSERTHIKLSEASFEELRRKLVERGFIPDLSETRELKIGPLHIHRSVPRDEGKA